MSATRMLVVGLVLSSAICSIPSSNAQTLPALPQSYVDTSYPVQTGQSIPVSAGGDFQSALNSAQPGDTILLAAGATFVGPFTLPVKSGSGWILVRTSAADSSIPAQGKRMTPSYAAQLPKIVTPSTGPAIQTAAGAHHFRFVAVEVALASSATYSYGLIQLGDGSASQLPYSLIFDRVYVHGRSDATVRRGFALNCGTAAVIDSYISEVHEAGADSQAIAGWNGSGPFKIANNYLEGAGENILFGGADPTISNLVPSDIEVRGNYVNKPDSWRSSSWTIKNLFELKNARRVLVDGNIFEHNWPQAQNGFSILFTVRNQDGTAPWSVVEDITFTHNIARHLSSAVNVLGTDNLHPSGQTKRLLIKNNLFDDVNATNWGGSGRLFQMLDGAGDVTIDHNTAFHTGEVIMASGTPNPSFYYRNNLSPHNQYGVAGDGTFGNPMLTLTTYFPAAVFVRNILQGGNPLSYPPDNFFPLTMADVLFVDLLGGNYRLQLISPYKNAGTDGKDVGADIDSIDAATKNAISGDSGGGPPPPPPDTTPPSVSITAPANGATVSGTTPVSADASDNVGVVGVQFLLDGSNLGAEDTVAPYQISWDTTKTTNGSHTLTARARDAAGNNNTSAPVTVTVANSSPSQSPFSGTPYAVPGQFEAENFDNGGEGVAYHDNTPGNQGGMYRTTEDVDIISPYAGGYVVNNFETGEWLEYTINVTSSGTYRMEALVSSLYNNSSFHMEMDGTDKTGLITAPNTGSWYTFQWVGKGGISLSAGQHVLRIFANMQYFNLDAIRISNGKSPSAPSDTTPPTVAITAPSSGATVSGTIQVSANASDNVGVVGVQFYLDGSPLGAEDSTAPYSISWNTTATADGSHTLTAVARDAANNRNTSTPVSVAVSNTPPTSQRSPFKGVPSAVPGLFEAEDFDRGGEGVAYHDLTPGNQGGAYRISEGVDIITLPQGYAVTNFATGEWMEYTINVSQSGTYRLEALVSSAISTSHFHIEIDRVNMTGLIAVPNTGSLANYQWVGKSGISLSGGQHILRIFAEQQFFNIDAIRSSADSKTRGRTVR